MVQIVVVSLLLKSSPQRVRVVWPATLPYERSDSRVGLKMSRTNSRLIAWMVSGVRNVRLMMKRAHDER